MELSTLLETMAVREASDLHFVAGQPPAFRADGLLQRADDLPSLTEDDIETLLAAHLSPEQMAALEACPARDVDKTLRVNGQVFRCHVFREGGRLSAAVRRVQTHVPDLAELHYPDDSVLHQLIKRPRGLIFVTGTTGSGKVTTLSAMVETINQTTPARIVTIENTLDYVFSSKQGMITQRIVGEDVASVADGARSALRSDADIVVISQIPDLETVHLSLLLAESGRLVLATMFADTAPAAVARLVDVFPPAQQDTARRALARNLEAIVAQRLLPRLTPDGSFGRINANEILLVTPRVRQMITDGRETELGLAIEAGRHDGMQTMDDDLIRLFEQSQIRFETAQEHLADKGRIRVVPEENPSEG